MCGQIVGRGGYGPIRWSPSRGVVGSAYLEGLGTQSVSACGGEIVSNSPRLPIPARRAALALAGAAGAPRGGRGPWCVDCHGRTECAHGAFNQMSGLCTTYWWD